MKNYIFGYGSLIEKESRLRTTPNALIALPVRVSNYKRGWFARTGVAGLTTTFLGCVKDEKSHTNGVIYEVTQKELEATDEREQGYVRTAIDHEDVTDYSDQIDRDSKIWIYADVFKNKDELKSKLPTKDFPIVQSYVDICVNGCIEIESIFPLAKKDNFARDFIKSTQYWNEYWVNDRIYPRRPFIYRKNAYQIDELLKENLEDKNLFGKIYFE